MAENIEVAELIAKLRLDTAEFRDQIAKATAEERDLATAVQTATAATEKQGQGLRQLLDHLEPSRVAAEKLAEEQRILADALTRGDVSADRYRASLNALQAEQEQTTNKTGLLSGGLTGLMGTLGLSFGAAEVLRGGMRFLGESITKAIDVTESRNLFLVSMGTMAEEAEAWAKSLRDSLGLNAEEVKKQVGTWNVMLTNMGLGAGEAYKMAQGLTLLSADMSSFYNLKPDEVFQKLQSGIAGEIEPLRRLGISVDEASVKTYAYTHGIAKMGEELTQQEKILARFGVIMESTTLAQGDLARTIDSPANQLRILTTRWEELQLSVGAFVIEGERGSQTIKLLNNVLADTKTVLDDIIRRLPSLRSESALMLNLFDAFYAFGKSTPLAGAFISLDAISSLKAWADAARSAELAHTKLAKSHTALVGEATTTVKLTKEQTQALEALIGKLDPVAKKQKERAEDERLLKVALDAGEISQRQYTTAMEQLGEGAKASAETVRRFKDSAKEAAEEMKGMTSSFETAMASLANPQTFLADWTTGFGQLATAAADPFAASFSAELGAQLGLESTRTDAFGLASALGAGMQSEAVSYSITRPTKAAIKLGVQEGLTEGPQIPANIAWMREYSDQLQGTLEDSLGRGLRGGLEALFRGEDFTNAWESMWNDLAAIAATSMAGTIKQGLFGGSGPLGENIAGLFGNRTGTAMTTGQKWQLAGQVLGAGLMYYGQQRQDATAATAGGAISGAVSGWQMSGGNPWGAVIGAVVGGYLSWQGAQSKKTDYNVFRNPKTGKMEVDVTGYGQMEEDEMSRQLYDAQLGYRRSFSSIARSLNFSMPPGMDTGNFNRSGEAGNFGDWWKAYMSGDMPRTMWGSGVSWKVESGLQAMGVSKTRTAALMGEFQAGGFDTALQDLQNFISALTGLKDVSDLLGMTPDQLRSVVNMTLRDGFLKGFEDTMDGVSELMDGVSGMFSQEQVANAQELTALAQVQYDAGLQYFAQLEQLRQSIGTSFEDMFMGFEQQRARKGGFEAEWLSGQVGQLVAQLQDAKSSEEVQRLVSQIQSYGGQAWSMFSDIGQEGGQTWIEDRLREAQRLSDEKLKVWEDEVAAKNLELKAQIDAMTAALSGSTTAAGATDASVTGLSGSADNASAAVDALTMATDGAAANVGLLSGRAWEAVGALESFAAALGAAAPASGWN